MRWLALLPLAQRQVVAWRCISMWSWRRIAKALCMAKSTAHERYHAALVALCVQLNGRCLSVSQKSPSSSSIPDRNAA